MNILWEGARGIPVMQLQKKLMQLGVNVGFIDGIFGPSTTMAIATIQQKQKLHPSGIVDRQTLIALGLPTPENAPARFNVFVSYSRKDAKWLQMLQTHIAPLEREGHVKLWDDTKIKPGRNWQTEIAKAIEGSKVAVLLLSPEFMASEYIADNELPSLLRAAREDAVTILPVVISPCTMGQLAEFQSVNSPSRPLVDMARGDRDRVWIRVVEAITAALNE